jgi:hypothetical protein
VRQKLKLCIGLTGHGRSTADLVERVAHLLRRTPVARRVIELLGDISVGGLEALAVGDIDSPGAAVRPGPRAAGGAAPVDAGAGPAWSTVRGRAGPSGQADRGGRRRAVIALAPFAPQRRARALARRRASTGWS